MLSKKLKKILFIAFTFIGACFYLIGNSISEGISAISGRKPAELKLKVTKRNSKIENMYIDRETKQIFYFFGNEGLVNGDSVNITEELSNQKTKMVSISKENRNEISEQNKITDKNILPYIFKGDNSNIAIAQYEKEPSKLYIEFYDNKKELKKIVKNSFKNIKILKINAELDAKDEKLNIKIDSETKNNIKIDSQKIEIFGVDSIIGGGKVEYTLDEYEVEGNKNKNKILRIDYKVKFAKIFIAVLDNKNNLKELYEVNNKGNDYKNILEKSAVFQWDSPSIDITNWVRKNILKRSRAQMNTNVTYGEEVVTDGTTFPYIELKLGKITIPQSNSENKIEVAKSNIEATRGNVNFLNSNNKTIVGKVYLKVQSTGLKTPVKGQDNKDIPSSTSKIEFLNGETKEADIYLRVYDLPKNLDSLFVVGKLKSMSDGISNNKIEIYDGSTLIQSKQIPDINIYNLKEDLRKNFNITKKNIDLSESVGFNIKEDVKWCFENNYVDINLGEIVVNEFKDETYKLDSPYVAFNSPVGVLSNYTLEVGALKIVPNKVFIELRNGLGEGAITDGTKTIGYEKIVAESINSTIKELKGSIKVRLTKDDFIKIKNSAENIILLKNEKNQPANLNIVFNKNYPEKNILVPFESFSFLKKITEKYGNEVNLDGVIFFNEYSDKYLNMIFDFNENSNGYIGIRKPSAEINDVHDKLNGLSVFNMNKGLVSRVYRDTDVINYSNLVGITGVKDSGAKFSKDGYKGVKFTARGINFELKFWNNTNKIELTADKGNVVEGEISGIFEIADENGNIYNKINLNIQSSTKLIQMNTDVLRVWKKYVFSSEWNTNIEVISTTNSAEHEPNLTTEGGLHSTSLPFTSYKKDEVYLEAIRGVSIDGVDGRGVKLGTFTNKTNEGTFKDGKLYFDPSGKGNARVQLTLTEDLIESYFPTNKPHISYKYIDVAEIVFGNGKRRVAIPVRIQLRYLGENGSSVFPTKLKDYVKEQGYLLNGIYSETVTAELKEITSGRERSILSLSPDIINKGSVSVIDTGKTFNIKGKTLPIMARVIAPNNSVYRSSGLEIKDIILSDTDEYIGTFTMLNGYQDIREREIWISKYLPLEEIQSINSDFISENEVLKRYKKTIEIDRDFSIKTDGENVLVEKLGTIYLQRLTTSRSNDILRNSSTLNRAVLPEKITLEDETGEVINAKLSFSQNKVELEAVQNIKNIVESNIYILLTKDEALKLKADKNYRLKGNYSANTISSKNEVTDGLLYYGLKTDNTADLGLNEYIFNPGFALDLTFVEKKKEKIQISLGNGDNRPLIKATGIEKNIRVFKNEAKYSNDFLDKENYSSISVKGNLAPYDYTREEFSTTHNFRITDLITGKQTTATVDSLGGSADIETTLGTFSVGYSSDVKVGSGFVVKNPLEILNIGVKEYNFTKGSSKFKIEHLDSKDNATVLTKDEIHLDLPEFRPKEWYYNNNNLQKLNENTIGVLKNYSTDKLLYLLGEVGVNPDIDTSLSINKSDSIGVRIEYDKEIVLTDIENKESIKGKIVEIDSQGNVLPYSNILKDRVKLGLIVNRKEVNKIFKFTNPMANDIGSEINGKVIRIGRNGYWQSLVKDIQIEPVDINSNYTIKWNQNIIDVSGYNKETRFLGINQNVVMGKEVLTDGRVVDYLDIEMGEMTIPESESSNKIALSLQKDEKLRGVITLKNLNGNILGGRLYLKSKTGTILSNSYGYDGKIIQDAGTEIKYGDKVEKKATIYLRVYDTLTKGITLFKNGELEYLDNFGSSKRIEVWNENGVVAVDDTIPNIEFEDIKEKLSENITIKRNIVDLSGDVGFNKGTSTRWVLGSRYVDLNLMTFDINNLEDKGLKLNSPYVYIDSTDEKIDKKINLEFEEIHPTKYYLENKKGDIEEKDQITHNKFILGYNKISAASNNGKINGISGNITIRIAREEFLKIKEDRGTKTINLLNSDGSNTYFNIVLDKTKPEKVIKIPMENFMLLKEENDKLNNNVNLKAMIYMPEIKENSLNLVFDSFNNSNGDILIRGEGQNINDNLSRLKGYSVFDMPEGILQTQYSDSDTISSSGITGAKIIGETEAKFSIDGYKGFKFQGDEGIEFELRVWNGSDRVEVILRKTEDIQESKRHYGVIELKNKEGKVLNKIEISLYINTIDIKLGIRIQSDNNLKVETNDESFVFDQNYNTETQLISKNFENGLDGIIGDNKKYRGVFHSFDGDEVYIEPISGISPTGIDGGSVKLIPNTENQVGNVRDNKLYLTSTIPGRSDNGLGNAKINFMLTKEWVKSRWPDSSVQSLEQVRLFEIVYGLGKRRALLQGIGLRSTTGSTTALTKSEYTVTTLDDFSRLGMLYNANAGVNNNIKILGIPKIGAEITLDHIKGPLNKEIYTKEFPPLKYREKFLGVYLQVPSYDPGNRNFNLHIKDVPITSIKEELGEFKMDLIFGNGEQLRQTKFYIDKYNPIQRSLSQTSSLYTNLDYSSKQYETAIEILRDDLSDANTTQKIVKNLGNIFVFGADLKESEYIKRSSKTLNLLKLPDEVQIVSETTGVSALAKLSFEPDRIEIEREQGEQMDKTFNIYLIIEKEQAKQLKPNENYKITGKFLENRVAINSMSGDELLYMGLKTDNISDLGNNELIYWPIFKMRFQTKIAQDTQVRLNLFRPNIKRPLVKSNGVDNLIRVYLDEAKYGIDVVGHANYSELEMSGLQNPYDYSRVDFGTTHRMKVTDLTYGGSSEAVINTTKGGYVYLTLPQANISLGYSDNLRVKEGLSALNSLEVLTLGLLEYKFIEGVLRLQIEHFPEKGSEAVIKEILTLKFPKFEPRAWYYDEDLINKIDRTAVSKIQYFNKESLIFPIGNVGLNPNRDRKITESSTDTIGIRIEHDNAIELVQKDDPSKKIQAKIIQISENGKEKVSEVIQNKSARLAISIDANQVGYDEKKSYIYTGGIMEIVDKSKTNKPIRIGRDGFWEGLVETIEIPPVQLGNLFLYTWNSGLVDITDWTRKNISKSRSFDLTKDWIQGEETLGDGRKIPYIDINMGSVDIFRSEPANVISLDHNFESTKRGQILLKNKDGKTIEGRIYLTSESKGGLYPVKSYDNKDIPNSSTKIIYSAGEYKGATVRVRVYDLPLGDRSLFIEGVLEYVKGIYSNNKTIKISLEKDGIEQVLKSEESIPNIEFMDLRDTLKENISIKKRVLNFSTRPGINIGTDTVWILGDKYIDIKLLDVYIEGFIDKSSRVKNPYIKIEDVLPKYVLDGVEKNVFQYYMVPKIGEVSKEDEVIDRETGRQIGYKKVFLQNKDENIGSIQAEVVIRLIKKDYEDIKGSLEKSFKLLNDSNNSAELSYVVDETKLDKTVHIPYNVFETIKTLDDQKNNEIDLKAMLYIPEFKENILNLVLDPAKNSTGNLSVRGNSANINDLLQEIQGYSVFDMKKGIVQTQYSDTDTLEIDGSITNAQNLGQTTAYFSKDGYKSIKFKGTQGIEFELKIWNYTNKVELTMNKSEATNTSLRHYGIILLKDEDGVIKNKINLSIYVNTIDPKIALDRTYGRVENQDTDFNYSQAFGTEVQIVDKEYNTRTEWVVKSNTRYRGVFHSYDGDQVILEPISGVGKEGVSGRGVELLPLTDSATQEGIVKDNKLYFTMTIPGTSTNGLGDAKLRLTLTKEWIKNRWKNNQDQSLEAVEIFNLVYGDGKRKIPIATQLRSTLGSTTAPSFGEQDINFPNQEILLGMGYNLHLTTNEFKVVKINGDSSEEILDHIVGAVNPETYRKDLPNIQFENKSLKNYFTIPAYINSRRFSVYFDDVPIVKERRYLTEYAMRLISGGGEKIAQWKIFLGKYLPSIECYSLNSSLQMNSDYTPKINSIGVEFYRENIDDRATTSEVVKEIGNIVILGRDKMRADVLRRSSTTLNKAKLPNRITLKRLENGLITKSIKGQLSFDPSVEKLESEQIQGVDIQEKIYLKIEKSEAENLDENAKYVVEAEYDSGRVSETKCITDNVIYLGVKTDNISDLGLDEYVYDPIAKLEVNTTLVKDNSIKVSLLGGEKQKPLPKAGTDKGLIRLYKNGITYSPDIVNSESYNELQKIGYMNPYNSEREDLKNSHRMLLTDEATSQTGEALVDINGGYADLRTPLGIITFGYSDNSSMINGTTALKPQEITTFGIKEYNFKKGDLRIKIEHMDPANMNLPIYEESLLIKLPTFEPKSWYYNEKNLNKLTNNKSIQMKYFTKNKFIYPLGTVGLDSTRDREITIGSDDTIGARIEYTKEVMLQDRNDPNHKIKGRIVKLDSTGTILSDEDIMSETAMLGVEIDITQPGYDSLKTYVLKGDSPLVITSDITQKPIRIGRNGYWESLVTNVQLRPVAMGDITLNLTKNYFRNSKLEFDLSGQLISGNGGYFTIKRNFIKNIPTNGVIKVYKWNSENDPYGEKLVEGTISAGTLTAPLTIENSVLSKTNYKIDILKLNQNDIEISLSAWGENVLNDKLYIEISDSLGITSMNKFSLNYTESKSMINIDYINSFAPGYEFAPGNKIPDAVGDSLYLGTILNPSSYKYQNERPQLESVNSLKISYIGDDIGLVNAIQSVKLTERNIELTNTMTGKKIEIEDISLHKVSKRYNSSVIAFFEEVYKMKGYIDFRKYLDLENGTYKGTVRLEIELN